MLAVVVSALLPVVHATQDPSSLSDVLAGAFRDYRDGAGAQKVEAACERVILALQGLTTLSDQQMQQLLTAYELRARTRFQLRNATGAREDFRAILMRAPEHRYGSATSQIPGSVNPEQEKIFEEVKSQSVGAIVVSVSPEDADVRFRDAVLPPDQRRAGAKLVLPVGTYSLTARRAMYAPQELQITVEAGATKEVPVVLDRLRSTILVLTSVAGVEVLVDNQSYGRTAAGSVPAGYGTRTDVLALGSAPALLMVPDVQTGPRNVELRLDCHQTSQTRFDVAKPGDYHIARTLAKSSAQLVVDGNGGTVFIDNESKGPVPYTGELCPKNEPRIVEVRSVRGRQIVRIDPLPGARIPLLANPRPAVAMLSQTEGSRTDLRPILEEAFLQAKVEGITFFALSRDIAQRELKTEDLVAGWLSHDVDGRPRTQAAKEMRPNARRQVSTNLSSRLDVQGIAEISVPSPQQEPRTVLLTYLAARSGVPETILVKLDEPRSVREAAAVFNSRMPTWVVSSGLQVADVQDAGGAVVLRQVWDVTGGAQMMPGDVIQSVDGRKIADGSAFDALVATKRAGDAMQLEVRGPTGTVRQVQLRPQSFPAVASYFDETLRINKMMLDLRLALQDAALEDQSILRLNLAVALMRAGNWNEARSELDKVELKDLAQGEGVSRGTVQYYVGLCLDALGSPAEADVAYKAAASSRGATLTTGGLLIEPLAREKLADKTRYQR
jgi:hypothetical protein